MQTPASAPTVSPEDARSLRANVWRFYLFRFFIDFQLWLPIWAVYLTEERGLELWQIGVFDGPFWILLIVLEVPTGAIADRWGRKVSLSYGALVNTIAVIVFGLASNFGILLASYLVWAAAFTLYSGADSAFVYDSLRAVGRENDFQKLWGRTRAVQAAGAILGLGFGSLMADLINLWVPVVASGGLMGIAWLVSFSFKEPPRLEEGRQQESYLTVTKNAFRVAFERPTVRMLMLLMATVMGIGVSMIILQQPFLDSHDVRYGLFGFFLMPGQFLSMAGALLAYRIVVAIGVSRLVALMPLVVIGTAVGLGAIDHVAAFAFYPPTTLMFAMSFVVMADYLNRRIPSATRATVLSIQNMLFSLIVGITEILLTVIGDWRGLPMAYWTAAVLLAVTGMPLLALWLREHRRETLPGEEPPAGAQPAAAAPEAEPEPAQPP